MAITKITTPELFDFSATNTALQLPTGDTASRPASPSAGEWRFNTDENYVEYWDGGAWRQIDTEALPLPDDFPSQNFNVNTYFGNGATQAIDAKFNEAANFNGSSSYIQINSIFDFSGNFSISMWFNTNTVTTTNQTLFATDGYDAGTGIALYINLATITLWDSSGKIFDAQGTVTGSVWNHITISRTYNSKWELYLNGALIDTNTITSLTSDFTPTALSYIGRTGPYPNYFDGKLDQIRIFNTALTAAQAEDLYTDETTTTAATLNFPVGAGCIAAYQLDGDASDVGGTYGGVTTDIGYTGLRFQPDMVWIKERSNPAEHALFDSVRGNQYLLSPNQSIAQIDQSANPALESFDTNGFTVDQTNTSNYYVNRSSQTYVAWCFNAGGAPTTTNSAGAGNVPTAGSVKIDGADLTTALAGTIPATKISANQKAGFSIVEYTGNSTAGATIGTGLSLPSQLIIIKNLNVIGGSSKNWTVYAEPLGNTDYLYLNSNAQAQTYNFWNNTSPVSGKFTVSSDTNVNSSSGNYIAYCFHSVDGYQKIGSYTGNTSNPPIVSTGFQPAFILIKNTSVGENWELYDDKRSVTNPRDDVIFANLNLQEYTNQSQREINFLDNGFQIVGNDSGINGNGNVLIYIAFAADKDSSVPTQANSFSPTLYTGNGIYPPNADGSDDVTVYTDFKPDLIWGKARTDSISHILIDSVRGDNKQLSSNSTDAEDVRDPATKPNAYKILNNGFSVNSWGNLNNAQDYVAWVWKAGGLPTINSDGNITSIVSANVAAGFSIVEYAGNGTAGATVGHGLTSLTPSLIIWKNMSATSNWLVYSPLIGNDSQYLYLNATNDAQTSGNQNEYPTYKTDPTSKLVTVNGAGSSNNINISGENTIMYCFADISGYQKVGTYNGSGVSGKQVTGLGFDPRFLIIKSTSVESWYMFDNVRLNGVYSNQLIANSSAAEQTGLYVDFITDGFKLDTAGSGINNGSTTYLYLAIG